MSATASSTPARLSAPENPRDASPRPRWSRRPSGPLAVSCLERACRTALRAGRAKTCRDPASGAYGSRAIDAPTTAHSRRRARLTYRTRRAAGQSGLDVRGSGYMRSACSALPWCSVSASRSSSAVGMIPRPSSQIFHHGASVRRAALTKIHTINAPMATENSAPPRPPRFERRCVLARRQPIAEPSSTGRRLSADSQVRWFKPGPSDQRTKARQPSGSRRHRSSVPGSQRPSWSTSHGFHSETGATG